MLTIIIMILKKIIYLLNLKDNKMKLKVVPEVVCNTYYFRWKDTFSGETPLIISFLLPFLNKAQRLEKSINFS